MQVRCPHCSNPIEVVEEVSLTDISCTSCGSSFNLAGEMETLSRPAANKTIGHFQLLHRLGVGAFGEVWRANDPQLDRSVAIKIPRKAHLDSSEFELFFREARAAAQLNHTNIVSIHEVGRQDGHVYIVSELVQGVTLADRIRAGALSSREAAELCEKVADALQHAHDRGVIHRDLKPSNIMLDSNNEPHVMDFGLAKREAGEITMTIEGQLLGTPAYMSPEQAKGDAHDADARSDVYSLGIILFELLTAERPFRGNQRMLLHQLINEDAPSPRKFNATISRDLETICLKCLEKSPERRYQSAAELSQELRRFINGQPIKARPISALERGWRWSRRNPVTASLLTAIALSLVCGFAVSSYFALLANERAIAATRSARQASEQEARANEQADKAEAARQDAEELVSFMLGDLRERLEPLGRLDVMTGVGDEITDYYRRRRMGANDAAADVRYSQALGVLAEIAGELGEYERALKLNDQRTQMLEQHLPSSSGRSPEIEQERADALRQKARIQLDMKNVSGAAESLEQAVKIYDDLEAAELNDREILVDLASTLGEHSAVLIRLGNEEYAKTQLLRAMDHVVRANSAGLIGDHSLLHVSMLLHADQLAIPLQQIPWPLTADAPREEAERVLGVLIAANSDNYPLKFQIASLLHRVSPDIRGEAYFVADQLCAELVGQDPSNLRWRELQAEIQVVIGYELTQLGQRDKALPYLQQGLDSLKELAQSQRTNPRVRHRLAMAYRFNGWWHLLAGDYTAAQASFRTGIETIEPLISGDNDDAGLIYTYTFLHIWLGEVLRVPSEKADAILPALEHIDRIGAKLPGNEEIQNARFQAHDRLSNFLLRAGDAAEAERQNSLAREGILEYRRVAGKNARLRRVYAQGWRTRARLLWSANRREEAYAAYVETAMAWADLVKRPELHARGNYMSGLCGDLHQLLHCPAENVDRKLDFVYEYADLVEQNLAEIEADQSRLPDLVTKLQNVWRTAAIMAGRAARKEKQAEFWDRFLALTQKALALSEPASDIRQSIRNDSITILLSDVDLRRFAESEGSWEPIVDQAIQLAQASTHFDEDSIESWRLLASAYKLKASQFDEQQTSDEAKLFFTEYESAARRALQLDHEHFAEDDWRRYASHHFVGHALIGQNRFEEAEVVLTEGFTGLARLESAIPGAQRDDYKSTAIRLVQLYLAWDKLDDVEKWQMEVTRLNQ